MIRNTKISIIAAMDEKRGIGKDNKIPWHISEDFKRFKRITSGHPIIMGRKTWESLPFKPLQNRTNIIITRDQKFNPHQSHHKLRNCSNCEGLGCAVVRSLDQAIKKAKEILHSIKAIGSEAQARRDDKVREVFIIGGGQIFQQGLPLTDKLYLTIVRGDYNCDTFFPRFSEFKKVISEEEKESEGYKYKFLELER